MTEISFSQLMALPGVAILTGMAFICWRCRDMRSKQR